MLRTILVTIFFVASSEGCGGTVVSNADSGGNSPDASAQDGTVSTTKGVACGSATCVAGSETCCVDTMSTKCMPSSTGSCSGQVFRVECDDADDCPGGEKCCFTNVLSSAQGATHCAMKCDGFGMFQLCKRASDCPNGACNTYMCGGSFGMGSITLGLCASTPPMFCK